MKQNLLPILLCCVAVSGLGAQDLRADNTKQPQLWRPTVINYFSKGDNGWWLYSKVNNQYDLFTGNLLNKEVINYNSTGEIIYSYRDIYEGVAAIVDENIYYRQDGVQSVINKIQYDPIVATLWVYQEQWSNFVNGEYLDEPVLVQLFKNEVNRNEAGNITSIKLYRQNVISNPDVWEPSQSWFEVEYDDAQKAIAITRYRQSPGEDLVEVSSITDIVWDRTDGQIVDDGSYNSFVNIYSPNRILSATLNGGFSSIIPFGKLTASYSQQDNYNYGYEWSLKINDDDELPLQSHSMSNTINFNQREYEVERFSGFPNLDEDTGEYKIETGTKDIYKEILNLYGVAMSTIQKTYRGDELIDERVTGFVIEYDPEEGYPLVKYGDNTKSVYEESVFLDSSAGIDEIVNDEAEVKYFNLQGLEVTNPTNGIYIRRQGSKVTKVLINK